MLIPASLWYLVGAPGVGKLTVARELERRTGAVVVDNHLWNDAVLVPAGVGRGGDIRAVDDLREEVRQITMQALERAPRELSHVLTHYLDDDPECAQIVDDMRALAERRGVAFRPVWLTASTEALAERVTSPDRRTTKLGDVAALTALLTEQGILPPPPEALVLDTTALSPAQTVDALLTWAQKQSGWDA